MPFFRRLVVLLLLLFSLGVSAEDPEIILEMITNKKSVYVGEPFIVRVNIMQHRRSRAVDAEFSMPESETFRTNLLQKETLTEEKGEYTLTRLNYVMEALQSGPQTLLPAQMKIATVVPARNSIGVWASSMSWQNYISNTVTLDVRALPDGVSLVGSFAISAVADTTEPEANEAVNVTLHINGSGNLESIPSHVPSIPGVSVFSEEGEITGRMEQENYIGSMTRKLVFVSERSFTIPPFTLRYFDSDAKTVKTAESEAIRISVKTGAAEQPDIAITPASVSAAQEKTQPGQPWKLSFAQGVYLGLLISMIIMLLPWKRRFTKEGEVVKIDLNDQKSVLMLLLQYRDDPEAAEMVHRLEGNLYEGKCDAVDAKVLKRLVKRVSN